MALPPPHSSPDNVARLLLGWSTPENSQDGTVTESCADSAIDRDEKQWTALHSWIRTSVQGSDGFKTAVNILCGEHGRIVFSSDCAAESVGSSSSREPLLIMKAYFRLLRFSFEPLTAVHDSSNSTMKKDEWNNFSKLLLKHLGDSLKSFIQNQLQSLKSCDGCPTDTNTTLQLHDRSFYALRNSFILFYFRSILIHVTPHVPNNTKILGPTYKMFSEVSELFVSQLEAEANKFADIVSSLLPVVGWKALSKIQEDVNLLKSAWEEFNDCLRKGIFSLLELMKEGLQLVQKALSGEHIMTSMPDRHSKIMVFIMARINSLLFLRRKKFHHYRKMLGSKTMLCEGKKLHRTDIGDDGESQLISDALSLFIRIRSLSVIVEEYLNDSTVQDYRLMLFKMMKELGARVDVYTTKMLWISDVVQTTDDDIACIGLKFLTNLPFEEYCFPLIINRGEDLSSKSLNIFPLGKLFLMMHVLRRLIEAVPSSRTSNVSAAIVELCEATIMSIAPNCFFFFRIKSASDSGLNNYWPSNILTDLIRVVKDATLSVFLSDSREKSTTAIRRQHHILILWLLGSPSSSSSSYSHCRNHPLSNEIIICVILTRISSSYAMSDKYAKQDAHGLITLLSQLLFHQRTDIHLRRLVATVLVRLLRSSNVSDDKDVRSRSENTKATSVQIMWRELTRSAAFSSTTAVDIVHRTGKRKRRWHDKETHLISQIESTTICWVIGILVETTISLQMDANVIAGGELKLLWDAIMECNESRTGFIRHDGLAFKQCLLTSSLTGVMRCMPDIKNFLLFFNNQTIVKTSSPSLLIDNCLAYAQQMIKFGRRKKTLSCIDHICVQFIGVLAKFLGHEFSSSHVDCIGSMLKVFSSAASKGQSIEAARFQYVLVNSACKMGSIVKSHLSADSLKPIIEVINQKHLGSNWLLVAPVITQIEIFVRALPSNHRGMLPTVMSPTSKQLLMSRIRGELFCLTAEKMINHDSSSITTTYSIPQEFNFMLMHSTLYKESNRARLGGKTIQLNTGSKLLVSCNSCGDINALLVFPAESEPSTVWESVSTNCDVHMIESNSKVLLKQSYLDP